MPLSARPIVPVLLSASELKRNGIKYVLSIHSLLKNYLEGFHADTSF